jgi:outer membrane protein
MKFYNIALGVLSAAVIGLFIMLLNNKKSTPSNTPTPRSAAVTNGTTPASLPIAYFDIDSINEKYSYFTTMKAKLEQMKDRMDDQLQGMQTRLESTQSGFQKKAQAGSMTQQEQEAAMQTLAKMQQEMAGQREKYLEEFESTRKKSEQELKKSIQDYLKEYNTPQRYSFIMADEPGIFYYRDSIYNITSEILQGLNAAYKKKKQ